MRIRFRLGAATAALATAALLTFAATPAAAEKVNRQECFPWAFGTICVDDNYEFHTTETPSGMFVHQSNGTSRLRQTSQIAGVSCVFTSESTFHTTLVLRDGEAVERRERVEGSSRNECTANGVTFGVECTIDRDVHFAGGKYQRDEDDTSCTEF